MIPSRGAGVIAKAVGFEGDPLPLPVGVKAGGEEVEKRSDES